MLGALRRPGRGHAVALCLGLYALVLLLSPVLHHDFECHLKSPGHCTACVANPLASTAASGAEVGQAPLLVSALGDARPLEPRPDPCAATQPGRAPPRPL